jgi:single-strand DNA-binding protein
MNVTRTKTASGKTAPNGTTSSCGNEYLKKGGKVYIEGRLQTRSWEDKQTNQKKYMTEVVANDLVLLGGRGESGAESGGFSRGASAGNNNFDQRTPEPEPASVGSSPISDEDIPF